MKYKNNGLKQSSGIEITQQIPKKAQRGKIEKNEADCNRVFLNCSAQWVLKTQM